MSISEITSGFQIGPFTITNTMVWTWFVMLILAGVLIWLAKGAKLEPTGTKQTIAEFIVDLVNKMVSSSMGANKIVFAPYILALISFLALSNLSGFLFLGFVRPPTADWATTLALAVLTFCMMEGFGAGTQGLGTYLKGLAEPVAVLLPINIISEFAPIVSLSFRLFGNILGGLIIGTLVYNMVYLSSIKVTVWTIVGGVFLLVVLGTSLWSKYRSLTGTAKKIVTWVGALSLLPVLFICFVHFYFDVFSGLMQSYIFTMLTMMFVSDRIAEDWHAQQ